MNLFCIFSNAWDSMTGAADTGHSFTPMVNIDGTPMFNEHIDINGNPFGVTSFDSSSDTSTSFDCGADWSSDGFNDYS